MSAPQAGARPGVRVVRHMRQAPPPIVVDADEQRLNRLFRYAFGVTFAVLALIGALLFVG